MRKILASFISWCREIRCLTLDDLYNAGAADPDDEGQPDYRK